MPKTDASESFALSCAEADAVSAASLACRASVIRLQIPIITYRYTYNAVKDLCGIRYLHVGNLTFITMDCIGHKHVEVGGEREKEKWMSHERLQCQVTLL